MGRTRVPASARVQRLESEIARLRKAVDSMERSLARHEGRIRELTKSAEAVRKRHAVVAEALQLSEPPRKGDRGVVRDLQENVLRLEEYLLKTADRIESILTALKQHREFLTSVNKRLLNSGTKDRIRLELDVMKNTLSILALNGVDLDAALVKEIEKLRASVGKSEDLTELEKAKADLDRKFDGELKKFDLDAIWSKKKDIAGYV
ncbi:MAG: hypothetical protein A3K59_00830 [Euryarchaeota archaeon RBG_19FT_COMBO_69_17]|nr:MAG: hypothetical protein A3K59_00830 [Euryarchaeota archaeon RBG_19FT_COMBO_69_17]